MANTLVYSASEAPLLPLNCNASPRNACAMALRGNSRTNSPERLIWPATSKRYRAAKYCMAIRSPAGSFWAVESAAVSWAVPRATTDHRPL